MCTKNMISHCHCEHLVVVDYSVTSVLVSLVPLVV